MAVYIQAAEAISPQHTFQTDLFLTDPVPAEKDYFTCLHPDYKQLINPAALRRMSPVIRMGLATTKVCLENAGIKKPGAILVGSGLGCVRDTSKFLNQISDNREQLLNPTAFIQSTHNTVSGQIALMLGCRDDNLTFSQKTISFETALMDAMMLLNEPGIQHVLVGGLDEIVDESYELMVMAGCAKVRKESSGQRSSIPGAVMGEGAAFFVLSNAPAENTLARIEDMAIINPGRDSGQLKAAMDAFLGKNGLNTGDVDLFVSGRNEDARYNSIDDHMESHFSESMIVGYKHLVGQYDTASAFGTFLVSKIIRSGQVPESVRINGKSREKIDKCVVFNHGKDQDYTFLLITKP